jgi:hypothetical protein
MRTAKSYSGRAMPPTKTPTPMTSLRACIAAMRHQMAHYGLERQEAIWEWRWDVAGPHCPLPGLKATWRRDKTIL